MKALLRLMAPAILFILPALGATEGGIGRLYTGFLDPPREFTVRPFWFWNGRLDAREVEWQIEQMVSQGVFGAYVHNRTGLETPYLSEEYVGKKPVLDCGQVGVAAEVRVNDRPAGIRVWLPYSFGISKLGNNFGDRYAHDTKTTLGGCSLGPGA